MLCRVSTRIFHWCHQGPQGKIVITHEYLIYKYIFERLMRSAKKQLFQMWPRPVAKTDGADFDKNLISGIVFASLPAVTFQCAGEHLTAVKPLLLTRLQPLLSFSLCPPSTWCGSWGWSRGRAAPWSQAERWRVPPPWVLRGARVCFYGVEGDELTVRAGVLSWSRCWPPLWWRTCLWSPTSSPGCLRAPSKDQALCSSPLDVSTVKGSGDTFPVSPRNISWNCHSFWLRMWELA